MVVPLSASNSSSSRAWGMLWSADLSTSFCRGIHAELYKLLETAQQNGHIGGVHLIRMAQHRD